MKFDPCDWHAPEYNDEILILPALNNSSIESIEIPDSPANPYRGRRETGWNCGFAGCRRNRVEFDLGDYRSEADLNCDSAVDLTDAKPFARFGAVRCYSFGDFETTDIQSSLEHS